MLRRMPIAYRAPQYRLRDDFTAGTDVIQNWRTPTISGAPYFIIDTMRAISIGNGKLTFSGTTYNTGFMTASYARKNGRSMFWSVVDKTAAIGMIAGFHLAATISMTGSDVTYGYDYSNQSTIRTKNGVNVIVNYAVAATGIQSFAVIMRSSGAFQFYRDGASGPYRMAFMQPLSSGAVVGKYLIAGANGRAVYGVSGFVIADLPAPFTTDFGLAETRIPSVASGITGFHITSGWVEHTFRYPGTTRDIFQYRRTDNNNCWIVRASASGTIDLVERVSGTDNRRAFVAQTWASGTVYRVQMILDGQNMSSIVDQNVKATYVSASQASASGYAVTVSGTDFMTWPLYVDLDSYLSNATIVLKDTFSDTKPQGSYGVTSVDPGPGFKRYYDITGTNLITQSGRKLIINGNSNNWGGTYVIWSGQPRAVGRTMFANLQEISGQNANTWVGWSNIPHAASYANSKGAFSRVGLAPTTDFCPGTNGNATIVTGITAVSGIGQNAIVLSTSGFLHLAVVDGRWTMQWPGTLTTDAVLYPMWSHSHVGGSKYLDSEVKIVDLHGPWAVDYGITTDRIARNAANATITTLADSVIEWTFTAASGLNPELQFRRTDDNNCLVLKCPQASGTIRLYARSGGVETEQTGGTTTQTWTIGTSYRIIVVSEGSKVRTFVGNTASYSAKNSSDTVTYNQTASGAKVTASGTEFIAWPRFIPDSYTSLFI